MDFPILSDPTDQERQAALAAALRRQQTLGVVGQLTGNDVLGKVGTGLIQSAEKGQEDATAERQHRLTLALNAQKDKELQGYRADEVAGRKDAAEERKREFGLRREDLGLRKQELQAAAVERIKAKEADQLVKEREAFGKDITEAHGKGSELVKNTARKNASQRVLAGALDERGNVRADLTQEQVRALVADYQAMMGASNAEGALEAIVPKSFGGDAAHYLQYITGKPQPSHVVEMLGNFVDQARGEEATIGGQNRSLIQQELVTHGPLIQKDPWAQNMVKAHGIKIEDLDPQTMLPKENIDPIALGTRARAQSARQRAVSSRISALVASGMTNPEQIKAQLIAEGLGNGP